MTAVISTMAQGAPLVAAWAVTTMAVTFMLTLVAVAMHHLARGTVPYRWVWGTALFVAFGFTVTQPWRRDTPALSLALPMSAAVAGAPALLPQASGWDNAVAMLSGAARTAEAAVTATATAAATAVRTMPVAAKLFVVLLWPATSVALLVIGVWSYRRQRTVLRRATRVEVAGHTLFVSERTGPAVFGVRRPRIVVPAWFLQRTPDEQRMVVVHEQAHSAAKDPVLLLAACVVTALMPWNPCAWFMLSRLRLAIELDCDTRVLQAGATPRHYGALLINLSATATPAPRLTGAAAFSHHASHLERRLRFMTDRPVTHTTSRRLASLSLGALAIIAACGAELPTSAELEGMDVAAVQQRTTTLAPALASTRYIVDGREVTEVEAKALSANRIASISVRKLDKKTSELRIATRGAGDTASTPRTSLKRAEGALIAVRAQGSTDTNAVLIIGDSTRATPLKREFEGLIFVDGVKATEEAMKMSPDRIESIEVIKGAAAEKVYGPEGAKGVIRITTKKK